TVGNRPRSLCLSALTGCCTNEVFISYEFVAILLENAARKRASSDDEDLLVVLFEFFHQGNEIAVTADNPKRINMLPSKCHSQVVQSNITVLAVLIASRCQVALNHLTRMLGHAAAVFACAFPIAVGDLGNNFSALFDCLKNGPNIEVPV